VFGHLVTDCDLFRSHGRRCRHHSHWSTREANNHVVWRKLQIPASCCSGVGAGRRGWARLTRAFLPGAMGVGGPKPKRKAIKAAKAIFFPAGHIRSDSGPHPFVCRPADTADLQGPTAGSRPKRYNEVELRLARRWAASHPRGAPERCCNIRAQIDVGYALRCYGSPSLQGRRTWTDLAKGGRPAYLYRIQHGTRPSCCSPKCSAFLTRVRNIHPHADGLAAPRFPDGIPRLVWRIRSANGLLSRFCWTAFSAGPRCHWQKMAILTPCRGHEKSFPRGKLAKWSARLGPWASISFLRFPRRPRIRSVESPGSLTTTFRQAAQDARKGLSQCSL